MDIIMLALPRWDGPYSSTAFSMAKELSKNNRVFYIDNPFTVKDVITRFRSKQVKQRIASLLRGRNSITSLNEDGGQLICVTPPAALPINFLPAGFLYDAASGLNDRIVFGALKHLMSKFNVKDFIFINVYNPFYGRSFPSFFKPEMFIYYSVDNIAESAYVRKHGPRLESEMLQRADAVLTTSRELWNQARQKSSNAYYLPNAADIGLFLRKSHINIERPRELATVSTPIIVYTGHIDVRVDCDLIKSILQRHPDKTLLMVGPHSIESGLYENLKAFPNMLFVGPKKLAELPAYLLHSHCAIIPFKCNDLTKSIYPLKVNEYLAAGLPVVSTAFSEDIQGFRNVIEVAESEVDFCDRITTAIQTDHDGGREARVSVASGNTWENRAQRFWQIVGKFIKLPSHLNSMAPIS